MYVKTGYVYIMSNKHRTTFYIGVTNNISRRVSEHRAGMSKFTRRYNLHFLVYCETIRGMRKAIAREKQLKNWHRAWKINLIRSINPDMVDMMPIENS
jgi:putative endonuclease